MPACRNANGAPGKARRSRPGIGNSRISSRGADRCWSPIRWWPICSDSRRCWVAGRRLAACRRDAGRGVGPCRGQPPLPPVPTGCSWTRGADPGGLPNRRASRALCGRRVDRLLAGLRRRWCWRPPCARRPHRRCSGRIGRCCRAGRRPQATNRCLSGCTRLSRPDQRSCRVGFLRISSRRALACLAWRAIGTCAAAFRNRFAEAFVAAEIFAAVFIDGDRRLTDLAAKKIFRCKREGRG